jgi:mRNA-degrading endonuclease RelE of RelBE toxin-antitoxin system
VAKKGGKGQRAQRPVKPKAAALPFPKPFTIRLTASAEAVYKELREQSLAAEAKGETASQHCTTFRMVDNAIRTLIPSNPTSKNYALHGPLANFFRIAKGRTRIVWAVSTEHRAILIVFISDTLRKDGDAQDPYIILTRLAKGGYLKNVVNDWLRAFAVPPGAMVN